MTTVLFFGSFQHYSTIVLEALYNSPDIKVLGVVTSPPRPAGRHLRLTRTHTHDWAQAHDLPVFTPKALTDNWKLKTENLLGRPNFFVVAGYRLLLPPAWLAFPKVAALNFHPSLLPQYPGPAPVEWAMLKGESTTGISIIKMNEDYDQGPIIVQKKLSILSTDTRLTLYQKLYEHGAEMIVKLIENWNIENSLKIEKLKIENYCYARRLSRLDGYIPWPQAHAFLTGHPDSEIDRKLRAFIGFPGVWTQVTTPKGTKSLKILSPTQIQLEGKTPTRFTNLMHRAQYHRP